MEEEIIKQVAEQINKAVSEFREEASKSDIAPIVKDLKTALEEQNKKISTIEDSIQSSNETEKATFADITRISNSLSDMLETQKGILESIKGMNKSLNTATTGGGNGGTGDESVAPDGKGGGGGIRRLFSKASNFLNFGLIGGSIVDSAYSSGIDGGSEESVEYSGDIQTGEGLTEEKNQAIIDFSEKYNINPNALAGVLNVESGFETSIVGGAGDNYSGIFQLQSEQIAGLTESVFGEALTPEEYRKLSFEDQLKVYEQYMLKAIGGEEELKDFFTGDAEQDTSRLWALQLAPGNAKNIDYSDPNALISDTKQAGIISATGGGVTVGSATGSLAKGGLLETENATMTPLSLNWDSEELPEGVTEGVNQTILTDPISGELFSVEFEVEKVGDKFVTTGPVTLTEDTDLEGVTGSAGDLVEVTEEMATDLASQIGATIESADLEEPAITDSDSLIPEVTQPSVDLEAEPAVVEDSSDSPYIEDETSPQMPSSTQPTYSDFTPTSLTGKWQERVYEYYGNYV